MVSQVNQEIFSTIEDLKLAKENLNRIKSQYINEPDILNFYLHSAKDMVKQLENHLEFLLKTETGSDYTINTIDDDIDVWIRIEGESFQDGTGPINVIGSYLQKLNTAARHSTKLIKNRIDDLKDINVIPSFELAATAKGSLKLGLKNKLPKEFYATKFEQQTLFDEDLDKRSDLIYKLNKVNHQGINVLFKALASANDESVIEELTNDFGPDDVIKLIHYAQELAPSSRSLIDNISFEGQDVRFTGYELKTNKDTRKILKERAKALFNNKEFVEGSAFIRSYAVDADKDYYQLEARPFKHESQKIESIELRANKKLFNFNEEQVFDTLIFITGFLYYNSNKQPTYIELDSINFDEFED
ncbi:hypothetical protein [Aquibacillus salsiterrae]|uniref:Uncharacterized protein n=1 Tax=Aquibacillus salsiterrae TaxID=2950439 RepID=A0A9X3WHL2_9BACI|nr:hypothetical protein [Aquibacillus salsiterrae]MDC3418605.1 hypothetical protein [Aquibacillus salsiterrae]